MSDWVEDLCEFHRAMDVPILAWPSIPAADRIALRLELVREETGELADAVDRRDLPDITDAIVDSIYVLIGMALEFGVNLHPVWNAVQAANMAKVGGPIREDGKRLKPPGWKPPDIPGVLAAQMGECGNGLVA